MTVYNTDAAGVLVWLLCAQLNNDELPGWGMEKHVCLARSAGLLDINQLYIINPVTNNIILNNPE